MNQKDTDIAELKDTCEKMVSLLNDNEQGLMTWWEFFSNNVKTLNRITNRILANDEVKVK